jgi:hypothetical protein
MKSPLPPRVPASGSRQPNLVGGCGVPHRPSLTTCSHRSIVSSSFFDSVFLTQLLLTTIPSRKAIPPIRTLLHFISLIKVFIKKLSRSIATSPCNYRCNKYLKKILAIKATSDMPAPPDFTLPPLWARVTIFALHRTSVEPTVHYRSNGLLLELIPNSTILPSLQNPNICCRMKPT